MPKKRKTRREKIQIDQKKQVGNESPVILSQSVHIPSQKQPKQEVVATATPTFSLPVSHIKNHSTQATKTITTVTIATQEYDYLGKDLVKTAFLTGAIIITELLIRLFYLH